MRLAATLLVLLLVAPVAPLAQGESAAPTVSRNLMPVVIPGWAVPSLATSATYVERPPPPMTGETPDGLVVPAVVGHAQGWPADRVGAFRVEDGSFWQIAVQVDERFPRFLTNYASGFGMYSQADYEMTYAYDWEGTRKTCETPGYPLTAAFCPGPVTTPDPVPGLDSDDEIVVMWRDLSTERAEPAYRESEVVVRDPLTGETRYVYFRGLDAPGGFYPLIRYEPDIDADTYILSNHGSYGGAPGGACHLGDGVDADFSRMSDACPNRRPKDSAWVETDTYRFHYSGRWKMDGLEIRTESGWSDSLIDRWKGRAFQQKEGNAANIGGFEDENDWTRSSVTLGVRAGPLRVIRETWGADSGTNVARIDAFYAHHFTQTYYVRVHPVPPDGIYAFFDHRAGMVDTYYTAVRPAGVPIDGVNDEIYGTNSEWQEDHLGRAYFTVDVPDPTLQPLVANEIWDVVEGNLATLVTHVATPPGAPSGLLTPYYRDDAQFEDGTGKESGSFGAHGMHFFFTSDTDNAFLPAPVNEFVAISSMLVLPGRAGNVGEEFAQLQRAPLVIVRGEATI